MCAVPGLPTSSATIGRRRGWQIDHRLRSRSASPPTAGFDFDAACRSHAGARTVDFLRIEARIDRLEALEQRRMRGEEAAHAGREQHVRDFFDFGIADARAGGARADLDQRAAQSARIARELHCRCIGERFARARHCGLDQATEEQADVADDQHGERDQHDDHHAALAVAAHASRATQHRAPDQCDHQQPEQQAHQPHVEPHVAVEDVAELVRDDALQLGAVERRQRAARHADRRVRRVVAGRERVDAALLLQQIDLGHRHAGGDRHFLDDVEQPALQRIGRVRRDAHAAERAGDDSAAAAEHHRLVEARERDDRRARTSVVPTTDARMHREPIGERRHVADACAPRPAASA